LTYIINKENKHKKSKLKPPLATYIFGQKLENKEMDFFLKGVNR
jgi:hypothetical protein